MVSTPRQWNFQQAQQDGRREVESSAHDIAIPAGRSEAESGEVLQCDNE
jgi:hypothetical protein